MYGMYFDVVQCALLQRPRLLCDMALPSLCHNTRPDRQNESMKGAYTASESMFEGSGKLSLK